MQYINNPTDSYVIGIDIGGTNFRIGSVDTELNLLQRQITSSSVFQEGGDAVEALAKAIATLMEQTPGQCRGIFAGFPGTVSKDKTTVLSCPNLPSFDGRNVAELLQRRFNVPVLVEHEVLLLLTYDLTKYQLQDKSCVMAVYLGTGLGNALYIHGRLLEGKNGTAGELGHIPVCRSQEQCSCGNVGCVEIYASGKVLEEIHRQNFPPGTPFTVLFKQHAQLPAFAQFLDDTACAVATEINILDPDAVILGGGIITNSQFPYETLVERIKFRARKPYPAEDLNFIRIEHNPDQGILGAAMYGLKRLQLLTD